LFETTALIVRSELANLLEQENLAARAAEAEAARTKAADGTAAGPGQGGNTGSGTSSNDGKRGATGSDDDADDGTDDEDQAARRERPLGAWSARAGFRVGRVDSEHYAYGPLLGVGYDVGDFAFGLQATTAWPLELELERDELVVELRRHSVGLSAQLVLYDRRELRLLGGVAGGALLYARNTEIRAGTLSKTPAEIALSASFGVGLELQWLPTPVLGVALGAGLDLLTAPPHFALQRAGGQEQVLHRIAAYEPWAALSIVLRP